jgi:hypothetical protein
MKPLTSLVGSWDLSGRIRWGENDGWVPIDANPAMLDTTLKGRFLRMTVGVRQGQAQLGMQFYWSYDPFQSLYRVAALDDQIGLLDTYVGKGDNPIVVDNLPSNTYWNGTFARRPARVHGRLRLHLRDSANFLMSQEITVDSGRTWEPFFELTARRRPR